MGYRRGQYIRSEGKLRLVREVGRRQGVTPAQDIACSCCGYLVCSCFVRNAEGYSDYPGIDEASVAVSLSLDRQKGIVVKDCIFEFAEPPSEPPPPLPTGFGWGQHLPDACPQERSYVYHQAQPRQAIVNAAPRGWTGLVGVYRETVYDALADALWGESETGVAMVVGARDGWSFGDRWSFLGVNAEWHKLSAKTGSGRMLEHEARVLAQERDG